MVNMLDYPCQRCGWKFKGFHICAYDFNAVDDIMLATKVEPMKDPGKKHRPPSLAHQSEGGSPEHRSRISAGVIKAAARDPRRIERNKEIIRLYNEEELSMRETATRVGADFRTVANVIHSAAAEGDVVIRRNTPRRAGG